MVFAFDAIYNERRSAQELAPLPFQVGVNGLGVNRIVVPASHVYNPFGQDVTGLALRPGGALRRFEQDADTFRFSGGFDGSFTAGQPIEDLKSALARAAHEALPDAPLGEILITEIARQDV